METVVILRSSEGRFAGVALLRGRVRSIPKRLEFFAAGVLLALFSSFAFGQDQPQTAPKRQAGNGLQILTPTQGVDFSSYSRDLLASIKRGWIDSMPKSFYLGDSGIVDIRVQVRADGTFVNPDPQVERSSGKDALDAAAVAAIRAAAPFPHFPSKFKGATIELRISFFYNVPMSKPDPVVPPAKSDVGAEPPK